MTTATCRMTTSTVAADGPVSVTFAAASAIMGAMTHCGASWRMGLDGSATLARFTVYLASIALLALASTAALTIAASEDRDVSARTHRRVSTRALSHHTDPGGGTLDAYDH